MGSHLENFRSSFVGLNPGESRVTISLLSCLGWLLLDNGKFFIKLAEKCNDWISKNNYLLSIVGHSLPAC